MRGKISTRKRSREEKWEAIQFNSKIGKRKNLKPSLRKTVVCPVEKKRVTLIWSLEKSLSQKKITTNIRPDVPLKSKIGIFLISKNEVYSLEPRRFQNGRWGSTTIDANQLHCERIEGVRLCKKNGGKANQIVSDRGTKKRLK